MSAPTSSFSVRDGLPESLTVLEASAGTGKTFTLAALATLYIAEGVATPGQLCVATFTEAATAELRGRLRSRLADCVAFLAGGAADPQDELEEVLADGSAEEIDARLARLTSGLRDFDAASISTIHGFCSRVISAVSGVGAGMDLTADSDDVTEVVTDRYLSMLDDPGAPQIEFAALLSAVRTSLSLPAASFDIIGPDDPDHDPADMTLIERGRQMSAVADLVAACVREVRARRTRRRVRTFDDLLADTRDLLADPKGRASIVELRRRFRVVLIDEFQDTDQVQWDIFRSAFLEPLPGVDPVIVIVVGDPKQSIYRFRGAELSAYLAARQYALDNGGRLERLAINRRTDRPLIDGLNALMGDFTFGSEQIRYAPVDAAPDHQESAIRGVGEAPMQIRIPPPGVTTADPIRRVIKRDLVDEVVHLLGSAEILDDGRWRRLAPSDIGILVRSNEVGREYAAALRERKVPAVASSSDNVLSSAAADQWRVLLAALDRPTSGSAVRRAALSWFGGLSAADVAMLDSDEDRLAQLFETYRTWSILLAEKGLPALLSRVRAEGMAITVLSSTGGERDLTDLEHVAELLQSATAGRPTSAGALLGILDELERSSRSEGSAGADLYDRRIDRDDDTVKVLTVHKAKGLEFPVVLCPTIWNARQPSRERISHAAFDDGRRIDTDWVLGARAGAPYDRVSSRADEEEAGEARRAMYVALTRAKHRLITWWPPSYTWGSQAEFRDLMGHALRSAPAAPDGAAPTTKAKKPKKVALDPSRISEITGGLVEVVEIPENSSRPVLSLAADEPAVLETAVAGPIDWTWRRWSFTGIKRVSETEGGHGVAPAMVGGGHDEPSASADDTFEATTAPVMPLRSAPGGTAFGSLVHSVLEKVDFSADSRSEGALLTELRDECGKALRYRRIRGVDSDQLAAGLRVALQAPLGGQLGGFRLADLTTTDRLDELEFDFPLARIDASAIASVVLASLPADDPCRPWFESAIGLDVPIEGVINGSIDLVARTAVDGRMRYWLADYKTNIISDGIDFDDHDMLGEMIRDDYVLQSTLYQVALHRFLRWRLGSSYDPATDLLGAAYLFVRGMDPSRPADDTRGVHWWKLPLPALEALDALFSSEVVA